MPRYKLGPDGAYLDPNDEGPDQASPEQIAALQPKPKPSGLEDQMAGMMEQDIAPKNTGVSGFGGTGAPPIDQGEGYTAGQNGSVTPIAPAPTAYAGYGAPAAGPTGAAPAGFDAAKWGDPNKHDPKYDVGHAGQANPNLTAEQAVQIAGPGYSVYGKDKVIDANGDIYDFRNANGQPQWTWVGNKNTWAADAAGGSAPPQGPATQGLTPQAASQPSAIASPTGNPFGGGPMGDAISRLLAKGEAPVGEDQNINAATGAFRAQQDQARRGARHAMAQRMGVSGLNPGGEGSGALDSEIQSQFEQEGRDVGEFDANARLQEVQNKRQDVMNALGLAQGEEKLALEQYLAKLNSDIQRMSLGQQNTQFYDMLSYDMGLDANNSDARLLAMLGGISRGNL